MTAKTSWTERKRRAAATMKRLSEEHEVYMADHNAKYGNERKQDIKVAADVSDPVHATVMTLDEMNERLVFVGHAGAIVDRKTGRARKKDIAINEYAASVHITKVSNKEKFEQGLALWMKSPQRLSIDVLAWVPGQPEFCTPPETSDGARTALNMWRGLKPMPFPKNWKQRVKPFLDHVAYLVPNKDERVRFLKWLAHIVQHPEVLPHTSYLMITPTTGIGRNLLAAILTRVLRGHVAAGVSLPELLDGGFNGRLAQKLLATVDELKVGNGEGRYRRQQKLSMLVTEEHRHINPKFGVQSVEKNCCRWLMFSNYRDALPFSNADRRIVVIDNPVKRKPPSYYKKLYGLTDDKNFIGAVRKYLGSLDITDFNPGEHAPMNEAKVKALEVMTSDTDRAVCAFKEECKTDLVSMRSIRKYVESCDAFTNNQHLNHAITEAGMTLTGTRVKVKALRHAVVIVNGKWTAEDVKNAKPDALVKALGLDVKPNKKLDACEEYGNNPGPPED